jgi:hypothetical protein
MYLNAKMTPVATTPGMRGRDKGEWYGGGGEWMVREGVGVGRRNDPSIVCTYE